MKIAIYRATQHNEPRYAAETDQCSDDLLRIDFCLKKQHANNNGKNRREAVHDAGYSGV
jgi:hypothetical protein